MGSPAAAPRPTLPAIIAREHRRTRRRALIWVSLGVLALGGVALAVFLLRSKPVPMAQRFRTQPLSHGPLLREVTATGRIDALSSVTVGSEISGRIQTVEVDFNQTVKAGQVLARFDKASLEAQRAQSDALVAAAAAQSAQAEFDRTQAQRNLKRSEQLHAQKAIADQDYETAVTASLLSEARTKAAHAQLSAQEAANRVARSNLDHAVIRSPIDGVIINRSIDPGQTVASMLQSPVLFVVAADLQRMQVEAAVDEAYIAEIRPGQTARFSVNAWPDRVFEGKVTEVRNAARLVQDVVTYAAIIEVSNTDLSLRPGMTASVRIETRAEKDVDRVPNASLHFTPPGQSRGTSGSEVWVLNKEELTRVAVKPAFSDGELTMVPAGTIAPGSQLLTDLTPQGKKAYGLDKR